MSVFGRGRDATFASLPALIDRLAGLAPDAGCDEERLTALRTRAEELRARLDALYARFHDLRRAPAATSPASAKTTPPRLMRLAEDLCALHAKVAALGIWLHNRDHLDAFFADGAWLEAALAREQVHQYEVGDLDPRTARTLFDRMNSQREKHEFFSLRTMRQAAPGAHEAHHGTDRPASAA